MLAWLRKLFAAPPAIRPVGRNEPCPCGSGRKYKRCCFDRVERTHREQSNAEILEKDESIGGRASVADHALERANRYKPPKL